MKKFGLNLKVKGQMWHDDKKGLFHAKKKLENKIKNLTKVESRIIGEMNTTKFFCRAVNILLL